MNSIKFFKVTSLPAVLEPNSMYLVNTAGVLTAHISDNTGVSALQLSGGGGQNHTGILPYPIRGVSSRVVGDVDASALVTLGLITRRLYLSPFVTSRPLRLLGFRVGVAAAAVNSSVDIGIYNNISHFGEDQPGQLLASSGAIPTTIVGDRTQFCNFLFNTNTLYWIGLIAIGAPTLRALNLNSIMPSLGRLPNGGVTVTHLRRNYDVDSGVPSIGPLDSLNGVGSIPAIYLSEF